jgi:ABC-type transport system involved in multi-copper enzyme maturation permease subunit
LHPRDIATIARFEITRHLRSRHAIVAGVILVGFCGFGSYQLADFADQMAAVGRDLGPALGMITGMIESLTGLPAIAIGALLHEHPPVLVALFGMVMTLMPILCLTLAYDQTATDIETRHVRYLLFRTDRLSIYLGKSLGALGIVGAAIGAALLVVGTFLGLRSNSLEGMSGVVYLARIWLTAVAYSIPFVAFLGLMSALVGRPRRTLTFTVLYWFAVSTAAGVLGFVDVAFHKLRYLFPTVGRFELMLDDFSDMRTTVLYLLCFTLIAGGLGAWRFRTRDL